MRVAVDVFPVASKPAGIGRYVSMLLRGLSAHDGISELGCFCLCFNKPSPAPVLPGKASYRHIGLPGRIAGSWGFARGMSLFSTGWDIAHLTNYRPLPVRARATVATVYDLIFEAMPETFPEASLRRYRSDIVKCLRRADKVITISNCTREEIASRYRIPIETIEVVYPSVVLDTVDEGLPQREAGKIGERFGISGPYILYLGTIETRKNLVRLVRAFKRYCLREGGGIQLVLAGKMGFGSELVTDEIRKLGIGDRTFVLGYIDERGKWDLMAGAMAFAYPSLYEGFGIPVIEAMAAGVPVLTSSKPSLMEAAGDAALAVDPLCEDSLAEGLRKIITDTELREKLSSAGKARAAHFSLESMAAAQLRIYRSLA